MTECTYCDQGKKGDGKIYEDDKVVAMLSTAPAAKGHVLVMPWEHYPIFERVPDYVAAKLFIIANKISTVLFEALKVQGTNIMIENGTASGQKVAHFSISVIPRSEGDGMNFDWPPTEITDEQMSRAELSLKQFTEGVGAFEMESKPVALKETSTSLPGEKDYLKKRLRRIP